MAMNRRERRKADRFSKQNGKRLQKQAWSEFKDVTAEALSKHIMINGMTEKVGAFPNKVYQNNKYIVMVYYRCQRKGRQYTRVLTRRSDAKPILSWSDMFRIKNEVFGEEVEAVQFLPKKSELIDQAHLYWFWIEEGEEDDRGNERKD